MKAQEFFKQIANLNTNLADARATAEFLADNPVDGRPYDMNLREELIEAIRNAARLSEQINDSVLSD